MERDTLGLADDSLFIETINHLFKAADVDLLIRARSFSLERACGSDATGYQAADLLFEQGADAISFAGALIAPLLWRGLADLDEIRDHFGTAVAASVENISTPFKSPTDHCQYQRDDVQALLASNGNVPRKALVSITFRLLALKSATDCGKTATRKMVQETLDLFVPIAHRPGLGDLQRRLEDACFKPLPGIFDDYIGLPKDNGYQSLHTCVYPVREISRKPIEFQVRTVRIKHEVPYPAEAVHNAGVIKHTGKNGMQFRSHLCNGRSITGLAENSDGFRFAVRLEPLIAPAKAEPFASYEAYGAEDPPICPMEEVYLITYSAYSRWRVGRIR